MMNSSTQTSILETFKNLLGDEVSSLREDVFRYLRQSRLQSFEQVCPFLTTPIPYKTLVKVKGGSHQVSPISYVTQEQVTARDEMGDEVQFQPMVNGQVLPFDITKRMLEQDCIKLDLANKAGFFYWTSDYIDLWCHGRSVIFSNALFQRLQKGIFELNLQINGDVVQKKMKVEALPFAHLHPNERLKDELRDSRYYQGIRLTFENDFFDDEVQNAWIEISNVSLDNMELERVLRQFHLNLLPLMNYQVNYACPIRLDGSEENYPLISERGAHLSLLKLRSVRVLKQDGQSNLVATREMSHQDEISYELVRPSDESNHKQCQLYLYDVAYGEDTVLNIEASWYDKRRTIGKLSGFSFTSKPVESIVMQQYDFLEASDDIELDMEAMHKMQSLSYRKKLTGADLKLIAGLVSITGKTKERVKYLLEFCEKHSHEIYYESDLKIRAITTHPLLNEYLNTVLRLLVQYHRQLVG